jgi:diaminopimelate epimerase
MKIPFQKYHGTGNDFVMIDNRSHFFDGSDQKLIAHLCDRHFGIGADGLILLEKSDSYDFKMVYFNSDGNESSMCGNGGRCTVHFAQSLGLISEKTTFEANDGKHYAEIVGDFIALQMGDVTSIEVFENHTFINTGSPHHVEIVENLDDFPVFEMGRKKRYAAPYFEDGSNINFVELLQNKVFKVRTYERGVEDETLSCGTGVTAVAIAMYETGKTDENNVNLNVVGGKLEVSFEKEGSLYKNVFLKGPATFVYKGEFEIK